MKTIVRRVYLVVLACVALISFGASFTAVVASSASTAGADTTPQPGLPATVSADPLPTAQVDGVVESEVIVGNYVYATGKFSNIRPPGAAAGVNTEPYSNFIVYDVTTGQIVPGYQHSLNNPGSVVRSSPDGSRVFVGGDFTAVDGQSTSNLVAINTATGALDTTFRPWVYGVVHAIAATNSEVFFGGQFTQVNGVSRTDLAAVTFTGSLVAWAPTADNGIVNTMVLTPDQTRLIVGGRFTTLDGGQPAGGTGSLSVADGSMEPWALNQTVADDGSGAAVTSLSTDGTSIFGSGYVYESTKAPLTLEGTWSADPNTGAVNWINDCQGDTYGAYPVGQVLYTVSHAHSCQALGDFPNGTGTQRSLAFTTFATGTNGLPESGYTSFQGAPDSTLLHWYPDLAPGNFDGADQAAYAVTGNSNYVALGGEFLSSYGVPQQGLIRFAVSSIALNKMAPFQNSGLTPTVTQYGQSVKLTFSSTWDPDNAVLTYTVYRDGKAIGNVQADSEYWSSQKLSYVDSNAPPGEHTYRVRAADPYNNGSQGAVTNPVTTSGLPGSTTHPMQQSTSGLCLGVGSVPPDNTAGGSVVEGATVSPCVGAATSGSQLWTWAQGTLQDHGDCLDTTGKTAGSTAQLVGCDGAPTQGWYMNSQGQVVQSSTGLCLDSPTTTPVSGTALGTVACTSATSWAQPHSASLVTLAGTGQCLDAGQEAAGGAVVADGCNGLPTDGGGAGTNNGDQYWTHWWGGQLQAGATCLTSSDTASGSGLVLASCSPSDPAEVWTQNSAGAWQQKASGLCIVSSGGPTGLALGLCTSAPAWQLSSHQRSYIDPTSALCLDGGSQQAGNGLAEATCNGGATGNYATDATGDGEQMITDYPDGSLHIGSTCIDSSSGSPLLAACNGGAGQKWTITASGQLQVAGGTTCISTPATATSGQDTVLAPCSSASKYGAVGIP